MKTLKLYGDKPQLTAGVYDVWVAAESDETLPSYAVINRDTGVVEFRNENFNFIKDWIDHFVTQQKVDEPEAAVTDLAQFMGARKN